MYDAVKSYLLVTKPGIVFSNLISAAAGFCLAAGGRIDTALLLWSLIGTALVIASACVLNNIVDRHIDRIMIRTRNRVLARGLISTKGALIYALVLGVAGTALLWATTNILCVLIVAAGFTVYVFVYSLCLKRRSVFAALIGSLAGAAPPLAGYCTVNRHLDLGAMLLLLIFSLWQVAHAYAISVFRFGDYAAAALPVLPVRLGMAATKKHIFWSILAFVAAAMMPGVFGYAGTAYLAAAAVMSLFWLFMAWSGCRTSDDSGWGRRLFVFSILSITVLSIMMSIDAAPAGPAHAMLGGAP